MATNSKKEYQELLNRTESYAEQVRTLFARAVNDILALTTSVPHLEDGEVFSYSDNKKIAQKVTERLRNLHSVVYAAIKKDIELEWDEANKICDALAATCFGKEILLDKRFAGWFERNTEAMDAFINRSEAGLNLSDRIWQPVKQLRSEMELAMTVAIGDGDSAAQISRYVRQYLNNPDKLFRRVKDMEGNLKLSKAAKAYHPGQGVYRSSAKNAMRVARSETNMAYRRADNIRWQQMDFVLGQEIHLSRSHPVPDICDTLKGRYPKNFVFEGWHPQCFCYVTPVLLSEKQMSEMLQAKMEGKEYDVSDKTISTMPENFKSWTIDNKERIERAKERGTLPYFIKNNKNTVERIINPPTALETAKERHAARTPEQIRDIKRRWTLRNAEVRHADRTTEQEQAIVKAWNDRKATRKYGNNILSYMDGIPDVDTTALGKALNSGNDTAILTEAQKLKAIGKEILSYSNIDNPIQVAKQFSMADAKAVNEAVQKKLDSWAGLPLEQQAKKLKFEAYNYLGGNMNGVQQKYPTWAVSQKAYIKQLGIVEDKIYWQNTVNEFLDASSFQTKSQPYLDLVSKLQTAIHKKDKTVAQQTMLDIKKKREQLDKAAAQRAKKKGSKPVTFKDEDYSKERKDAALWTTSKDKMGKFDREPADKYFRKYAENDWKRWTQNEKEVAYNYTSGSSYINEPLYTTYYSTKYGVHGEIRNSWDDINTLTSMIDKTNPFDRDVWLNRGASAGEFLGQFGKDLDMYRSNPEKLIGLTGVQKPFMSTGHTKSWGFVDDGEEATARVVYNIYCPKGTKGIYTEPYSAFGTGGIGWDGKTKTPIRNEVEVILQRGSKFKVTKAEYKNGQWFIDLDLIEQPTKRANEI